MPDRVRLVHRIVGSYHVFTSPDVNGLHVSAASEADAQRAVIAMLDAIAARFGAARPAVDFVGIASAA
jgi:hypothetical protein